MKDHSPTVNSSNIAREYDFRRRLILIQRFGWLLVLFFFLGLGVLDIVYVVSGTQVSHNIIITTAMLQFILPLVAISGVLLARRGYAMIALVALSIAIFVPIVIIHMLFISNNKFDVQLITLFSSYTLIIAFTGLLGTINSIISTTVLLLIVELLIALQIPPQALSSQQIIIVMMNTFTQQIAMMIIMIFSYSSYLRTLQELGSSQEQVERAQKLDDLKNQFISSVNHELRTPVMAMLANIEGLHLMADKVTPERRKQMIDRAFTAGLNLRELLESILDTRRLDQGVRDFTPGAVYVAEILHTSIESVLSIDAKLAQRNIQIDVPAYIAIWGEKVRLQQILTNLLTNALKYSEDGTAIQITARSAAAAETIPGSKKRSPQENLDGVEISVRDWGLGIPPDQSPLLFQRFVRLSRDLASTRIGNGLGLYLCRILTEAMNGTIRVESTGVPNEGSNFILQFPAPPITIALPVTRKLSMPETISDTLK